MINRIIFVGIHNKVGTPPLSRVTKSGKLINRITEQLKDTPVLLTNLYNVEYCPVEKDKWRWALDWIERANPSPDDIIILLGLEVQKNNLYTSENIINMPHPSSIWSEQAKEKYIIQTLKLIRHAIENSKKNRILQEQGL